MGSRFRTHVVAFFGGSHLGLRRRLNGIADSVIDRNDEEFEEFLCELRAEAAADEFIGPV